MQYVNANLKKRSKENNKLKDAKEQIRGQALWAKRKYLWKLVIIFFLLK